MAIKRNVKVVITEDISKVSEKLYIYQHDRGIDITFDITENKFEFYKRVEKSVIDDTIMYASITIVKPDGTAFKREMLPIEENKVVFRVEHEHTDDFNEIGTYTLQAHLHDEEDNRVTIPPVILEVKELIADLDCITEAKADMAMVGVATVAEENILFTIENGYIKTNWRSGDIITASKLNKIEEALFETVEKVNSLELTGGGGTGEAGKDGVDGKSAYEIAVEEGFVGSQAEWLASLKGERGEQGLQGEKGEAGEQGPIGPQGPQGPQGEKGEKGDPGIQGERGEQGLPGERGEQGLPGQDGRDGADGKSVELQKSSTHVQWRLVGESSWNNLIALADLKGEKGEQGLQGIQGEQGLPGEKGEQGLAGEPGAKGEPGEAGRDGQDGKSVELQKNETHIQWRLAGEEVWNDLIALEELVIRDDSSSNVDLTNYYTKSEVDDMLVEKVGAVEDEAMQTIFADIPVFITSPPPEIDFEPINTAFYSKASNQQHILCYFKKSAEGNVMLDGDYIFFSNLTDNDVVIYSWDTRYDKWVTSFKISNITGNSAPAYKVDNFYYHDFDIYSRNNTTKIVRKNVKHDTSNDVNDFNNATTLKKYKVIQTTNILNSPIEGAFKGMLLVEKTKEIINQELIIDNNTVYTRVFANEAWTAWKKAGEDSGGSGNIDLSEIEDRLDNISSMLETTRASLVIDINKLVNLI